jgi:hypothetical protein
MNFRDMKKVIIIYKLLCLALLVSGQPTLDSSTWNKKVLKSNVYVRAGLVVDSNAIITQDIQADSCDFDYVYSAGDIAVANDLIIELNGNQDYKFTEDAGNAAAIALQGQTSGFNTALYFFPKDGDGSDNVNLGLFAKGSPADRTNSEVLYNLYNAASTEFRVFVQATGSGTVRPLIIYTGTNTDQIKLNTDGSVNMSGDLTVTGDQTLFAYMSFDDSSYVLPMTQNNFSIITNPANTLFTTGITRGITVTGDSIQIITAGNYDITFTMSWSGGNLSDNHAHIFVNGVELSNTGFHRDMTTTNVGDATLVYQGVFAANDWISFRIEDTNSSNDLTLKSGSVKIFKL